MILFQRLEERNILAAADSTHILAYAKRRNTVIKREEVF